jgi:D-glycero-D-manno-heptose 1,7-bisphosphate phosphatase
METVTNKAVFFDRDGILNQLVERDGSMYSPLNFDDFNIYDDAVMVISDIKQLNYLTIVVSNQPDITRGKLKLTDLDKMTQVLFDSLKIDDVFYCTHDDYNDEGCRKPKPGLFHLAQKKYNINFSNSIMVGDTWKDVEAAKNAGIRMLLLDRKYNQDIKHTERISELSEILDFIQ